MIESTAASEPTRLFSDEEFLTLSRELEKHHGVFYHLWQISRPQFTTKIPTAGVTFDKIGEVINFWINPDFWDTQTPIQKQFVICHECCHIILNHGKRMQNTTNPALTNKALDVVVNHNLIDRFGFKREEVDPSNKYCWLDTVFKPEDNIPENKTFEFYFNKLNENPENQQNSNLNIVDDHQGLEETDFSSVIDHLNENVSDEEKEGLKGMVQKHFDPEKECINREAGKTAGNGWVFAKVTKVKKKKKWETVIKKWAMKYMADAPEEQWTRINRRMAFFEGDLILPTEADTEALANDRIEVWYLQDTSGSCSGFIDRFFGAALSLPKERFDVKLFCFDTEVYPTTLESKKLYGFGGTSFSCIERYIQEYCKKNNSKYPIIFCITDGYGDQIQPQYPKNWYWFLSHDYKECIPKECNIFMLKDFE